MAPEDVLVGKSSVGNAETRCFELFTPGAGPDPDALGRLFTELVTLGQGSLFVPLAADAAQPPTEGGRPGEAFVRIVQRTTRPNALIQALANDSAIDDAAFVRLTVTAPLAFYDYDGRLVGVPLPPAQYTILVTIGARASGHDEVTLHCWPETEADRLTDGAGTLKKATSTFARTVLNARRPPTSGPLKAAAQMLVFASGQSQTDLFAAIAAHPTGLISAADGAVVVFVSSAHSEIDLLVISHQQPVVTLSEAALADWDAVAEISVSTAPGLLRLQGRAETFIDLSGDGPWRVRACRRSLGPKEAVRLDIWPRPATPDILLRTDSVALRHAANQRRLARQLGGATMSIPRTPGPGR